MASTNKTELLKLPQWQDTDKLEMTDLNDAFEKVDTGLKTHQAEEAHVLESGSNANGTYIKYQNGTMQCWLSRDVAVGDLTSGPHSRQWVFPVPFVGPYYCSYHLGVANEADAGRVQNQTITRRASRTGAEVWYRLVLSTALGSSASDELFAMGRWK